MYIAVFSKKAYEQIEKCVKSADNTYEVGGVLVGYRLLNFFFVVEVTFSENVAYASKTAFILDGELHTKKATDIIEKHHIHPKIIGSWHSHILDGGSLSKQDRISNRHLASLLNGALSMIVTMHDMIRFNTYYTTKRNCEFICINVRSMMI